MYPVSVPGGHATTWRISLACRPLRLCAWEPSGSQYPGPCSQPALPGQLSPSLSAGSTDDHERQCQSPDPRGQPCNASCTHSRESERQGGPRKEAVDSSLFLGVSDTQWKLRSWSGGTKEGLEVPHKQPCSDNSQSGVYASFTHVPVLKSPRASPGSYVQQNGGL